MPDPRIIRDPETGQHFELDPDGTEHEVFRVRDPDTQEVTWARPDPMPLEGGGDAPPTDVDPIRVPAGPTPTDPGFFESGGVGQASSRGLQRGVLGDTLAAQLGAGTQVATEYGKRGLAALGIGDAPSEHTFEEYLQAQLQAQARDDQHSPHAARWSKAGGTAAVAVLAPEVKAAQGAGLGARTMATAKNAALDASMGAAYAASESDAQDPANRMQDAAAGAMIGGGARAALGGVGEIARGVAGVPRHYARARAALDGPEAARIAGEMTDPGPAGVRRRALALSGDEVVDDLAPRVYDNLSRQQEVFAKVHEQTGVRMKAGPIARDLARTGKAPTGELVGDMAAIRQDVTDNVFNSRAGKDVAPGPGKNALNIAATGMETARRGMGRIKQSGPDASAEVFVIVDQLKRDIGRAAKKASGGGAAADEPLAEALWSQYERLRSYLEDAGTWGDGPAALQQRVNAAWVKYIDHAPAMDSYVMEAERLSPNRAPNNVDRVQRPGPTKVRGVLRSAGDFETMHPEQALRDGSRSLGELTDVLADAYELEAPLRKAARSSVDDATEVARAIDESSTARSAAGDMQRLREVGGNQFRLGPSPGEVATGIGMAERRLSNSALPAAGEAARIMPRGAAFMSAGDQAYSASEMVQRMARSDEGLAQLGHYGPLLQQAERDNNFGVAHSLLQQTDPEYQELLRGLEARAFSNSPARPGAGQEQ